MIEEQDVKVGVFFLYPHPSGFGTCRTVVREIRRPTPEFPRGRVRHEAIYAGWGSVDTMEAFTKHAAPDPEQ